MTAPSITVLIRQAQCGDRSAEATLYEAIEERLKVIARALLRSERQGHTLQATALLAEAFIQKLRGIRLPVANRDHFYSLAAIAMKRVLTDHARRKRSQKRTAPEQIAAWLANPNAGTGPEVGVMVRSAMARLQALDRQVHDVIVLVEVHRVPAAEVARRTGRPEWKVRSDCRFGLKWLADHLEAPN